MIDVYRFYDGDECVQELDMSDRQCFAMQGKESINEACGGCVGCLFLQATYSTIYSEEVEKIEGDKKYIKLTYEGSH